MTEIKTKWQYIANRCYNEGHNTAEDIAAQIDVLLDLLEMNDHTQQWIDATEDCSIEDMDTLTIAKSQEFCMACSVHDEEDRGAYSCDDCRFNKAGGSTLWIAFYKSYRNYIEASEECSR